MYVRRILEQVGDRVFTEVNGAGAELIAAINAILPDNPLVSTATGTETLAAFDRLPIEEQTRIETAVEDYMLKTFGGMSTAPVVVPTSTPITVTRDYRAFIAVMMSVSIVAMALGYIALVIYVSWFNHSIPEWTDIFIPFLTLGAVVWNYNGLLTKENRDAIAAGLGAVPGGFIASIVGAITAGRRRP